ncbi:MAG: XisI protein [Bacteroidota bacterium]
MDKIKKYQQILIETIESYAKRWERPDDPLQNIVIADVERGHFQFLRMGWKENDYIFGAVFHFDIIDDKVWVQENRTDILIAEELVERGIPKTDIVLGLQPPYARPYTEYAAS